ncbi:MAG: hypothetical protein HY744_23955 [Deltaproteobacteria bacterium]|nr:hypothetical protein [Deltaproteobacteria bacterium]
MLGLNPDDYDYYCEDETELMCPWAYHESAKISPQDCAIAHTDASILQSSFWP